MCLTQVLDAGPGTRADAADLAIPSCALNLAACCCRVPAALWIRRKMRSQVLSESW